MEGFQRNYRLKARENSNEVEREFMQKHERFKKPLIAMDLNIQEQNFSSCFRFLIYENTAHKAFDAVYRSRLNRKSAANEVCESITEHIKKNEIQDKIEFTLTKTFCISDEASFLFSFASFSGRRFRALTTTTVSL